MPNQPDMTGLLVLNKPAGMSSRQAVDAVAKRVKPIKVGHAGTLDPIASGVLVLCLGKATRLISYVQARAKHYRGLFLLGCQSPSDDVETELEQLPAAPVPTREQLEAAATQFQGTIEQVPPAYSAVKLQGKRAYKLARAGKEVTITPRQVRIDRLAITRFDYPQLELDIVCGSGTYVRSLGRDLAQAVGTAAVMRDLCRTAIGEFTLAEALSPQDITVEAITTHLLPARAAVDHLPSSTFVSEDIERIRNGLPPANQPRLAGDEEELAALDANGRLVSLLIRRKNLWSPRMWLG